MTDDRTETDAAVAVENMLLLRRQDFDEGLAALAVGLAFKPKLFGGGQ